MVKLGISIKTQPLELLDQYLSEMHPQGRLRNMNHFEVHYLSPYIGLENREEYMEAIRGRIVDNSLTASLHFPSFNLSERNQAIQRVIIEEFEGTVEYGATFGAQNIVIHPGYLDYYETPKEVDDYFANRLVRDLEGATQLSVALIKKLAPIAATKGMTILAETLPLPNGITKNCQELRNLQERVNAENVKFILDTGHLHVLQNDVYENLVCLGSDLLEIHAHDNNGKWDQHKIPGEGTVDWEGFKRGVKEIGFDGAIVFELPNIPLEGLVKAHDYLTSLFTD